MDNNSNIRLELKGMPGFYREQNKVKETFYKGTPEFYKKQNEINENFYKRELEIFNQGTMSGYHAVADVILAMIKDGRTMTDIEAYCNAEKSKIELLEQYKEKLKSSEN